MNPVKPRPAHRPSRRPEVIDAAMQLLSSRPSEDVTVTDIADAAGMTPAAIYYHFAGKDDILLEGLRAFGDALITEAADQVRAADLVAVSPGVVVSNLLEWTDAHRSSAQFYFYNSAGLSAVIEARRRATRIEVLDSLALLARHSNPKLTKTAAGVTATGMLSAFEIAAVSWLTKDDIFLGLGRRQFLIEVQLIVDRLVGAPPSPRPDSAAQPPRQ